MVSIVFDCSPASKTNFITSKPFSSSELSTVLPYSLTTFVSLIKQTFLADFTVAKAADEPVSTVYPDFTPAATANDELPTRPFQVVTDPDDDLGTTTQFSFEGFEK